MPSPVDRFIAAATAPLADNAELQMMAAEELRSRVQVEDVDGSKISATAELLEGGQRRSSRLPRICLYVATALISAIAMAFIAWDYPRYRVMAYLDFIGFEDPLNSISSSACFDRYRVKELPDLLGKFTPEEEVLLFGDLDPNKVFTAEQFGEPWRKNPHDPALFAEYARAMAIRKSLPANFLKDASLADPGNAYYHLLAATDMLRNSITRGPSGPKKSPFRIKDPAKLSAALQLLEEASAQPRYDSYRGELLMRRLQVLPPGDDLTGRRLAQGFIHQWYPSSPVYLADAVGAQAYVLAAAGDADGYQKLCATWERVLRMIIASEGSLPEDAIQAGRAMSAVTYNLSRTARMLKLDAGMQRYRDMSRELNRREYVYADWTNEMEKEIRRRAGSVYLRFDDERARTLVPVTPGDAQLKPGRLAQHAFSSRWRAFAGWLLFLLLSLLTAGCRFRHGTQARRLSAALKGILSVKDHVMIVGLGVFLPFLIHLLLEHFTPLGGTLWNRNVTAPADLHRKAALGVMMLALPCAIAARFLQEHYSCIGWKLRPREFLPILICAGVAWLAGGLMGWLGIPENSETRDIVFISLLWVLGLGAIGAILYPLKALLASRQSALEAMTACRAVIPAYATAILLLAAVTLLYHAEEKYWIRRDKLTELEAGIPASTRSDYEAAKQARAELLEILDAKP